MALRRTRRQSRQPVAHTIANSPSTDQTLLDMVNDLREVSERVASLEHRFDALGTAAADPDGDDVMDLRIGLARLSAEISRVAVELNARIAEVAGSAGIALTSEPVTPKLAGDESFADLSADSPARARTGAPTGKSTTRRSSGWQPAD